MLQVMCGVTGLSIAVLNIANGLMFKGGELFLFKLAKHDDPFTVWIRSEYN